MVRCMVELRTNTPILRSSIWINSLDLNASTFVAKGNFLDIDVTLCFRH